MLFFSFFVFTDPSVNYVNGDYKKKWTKSFSHPITMCLLMLLPLAFIVVKHNLIVIQSPKTHVISSCEWAFEFPD